MTFFCGVKEKGHNLLHQYALKSIILTYEIKILKIDFVAIFRIKSVYVVLIFQDEICNFFSSYLFSLVISAGNGKVLNQPVFLSILCQLYQECLNLKYSSYFSQ